MESLRISGKCENALNGYLMPMVAQTVLIHRNDTNIRPNGSLECNFPWESTDYYYRKSRKGIMDFMVDSGIWGDGTN